MKMDKISHDAFTTAADAVPHDIIAQQRSAGIPELLISMQVDPAKFAEGAVKPRKMLDGLVIPEGTFTLAALDGASGKSTGVRGAAAFAADTGLWCLFGERQHDRPLKVVLFHGEETAEDIVQSFATIDGAMAAYRRAVRHHRLFVISMTDYQQRLDRPEQIFDKEGKLTVLGAEIFQAIEQYQPDVIVLDTIGSMSDSEYLDGISSKNMVNAVNRLCARCNGATAIGFLHLTKDAGSKVGPDMSPSDLQNLNRGSAMLKNSTRSLLVATRAPAGMYPGISVREGDQLWVATSKCNIPGAKYNGKLFPFVRDSRRMTLLAQGQDGQALAETVDSDNRDATKALLKYLPHLIRAASDARKPFPTFVKNRFSLQTMLTGPMSGYFTEKLSAELISGALASLLKDGIIVECSDTRAAGAMVYCVPGGNFADPTGYRAATGEDLKIKKGEYPIEELRDRMRELHDEAKSDGARKAAPGRPPVAAADSQDTEAQEPVRPFLEDPADQAGTDAPF